MSEAVQRGRAEGLGDAWRTCLVFCAVALGVALAYLGTAAVFADLRVFADPDDRFGVVRRARFNAALGVVLSYLCASLWLGQRWVRRDFDDLRTAVDATDAEWSALRERARTPGPAALARASALGAVIGLMIDVIGAGPSDSFPFWLGHRVWVYVLNPLVFAALGVLVALSRARAAVYQELGRRARVTVGEIAGLAPFARIGLRTALLWFLGTSLASLLLVDTDSPMLVVSILLATTAFAASALVAPSRGVHERLRQAKQRELAWLRAEVARAGEALRRGDAHGAAQLPALVAWEGRVAAAPEWPFDTATWLRFALLLLVPLGSWLGGALAERVVESWLGA